MPIETILTTDTPNEGREKFNDLITLMVDDGLILSGSGSPASSLGDDGQYYFDTSNGDFYQKDSGSWSVVLNLRGQDGAGHFARENSLADLKARAAPSGDAAVFMAGRSSVNDGGEGFFIWRSGDQSANVSSDPAEGIWVPPDTDSTGSSGAWSRVYSGPLNVKWFGATADGVTNDADAIGNADSVSGSMFFPRGTYYISTNVDIDSNFSADGAVLKMDGATVNVNGLVDNSPSKLFEFASGVTFSMTVAQDVFVDWFDANSDLCLRRAVKLSAAGSRIKLLGKTYTTQAISWTNDPLSSDGDDTGKVIEGVSPAQRYNTTGSFFGSRLVLADNQDDNMFTIDSGDANEFGSGAIRNVMLEGNKGSQTAGSGVEFKSVKDFALENIYAWNFKDNGLNFTGANNQIALEGFIEVWNNDNDGIRGAAMGDIQANGSIRCVNNGRYGFYFAGGQGRFNQIFSYSNANAGVYFPSSADNHVYVTYIRSEDNDLQGVRVDGSNVSLDYVSVSDNGVSGSTGVEKSGLYLSSNAADVMVGHLTNIRRPGVTNNQQFLLYDLSAVGCTINRMTNIAFGLYGSGESTAVFSNNDALTGVWVGARRTFSDTYANVKNAGASFDPLPDTYGKYSVVDVTEDITVNAPPAGRAGQHMELSFQITSSGSHTVNWGSNYLDSSGGAISGTATTDGDTVHAAFRKFEGNNWYLLAPIVVS